MALRIGFLQVIYIYIYYFQNRRYPINYMNAVNYKSCDEYHEKNKDLKIETLLAQITERQQTLTENQKNNDKSSEKIDSANLLKNQIKK